MIIKEDIMILNPASGYIAKADYSKRMGLPHRKTGKSWNTPDYA